MSISPAHRTLTPVQTGMQMAAVPQSLTRCGGPCTTPQPALEIHCDQRRLTGQEKTASPYASTLERWNRVWRRYPQTTRVSAPLRPHSLGRSGASLLWDAPLGFVPRPACGPAAVICSGPGSRDKRGMEGLDRGVGGAAPIHFRTVRDHHCLPSHPVTYYHQTTGWHPVYFYACDSTKTVLDVWSWHRTRTRALYKQAHCKSLSQTHTLHTQTHCHHYRHFSANLHIGLWVVQLFLADCVWEGQSHRR